LSSTNARRATNRRAGSLRIQTGGHATATGPDTSGFDGAHARAARRATKRLADDADLLTGLGLLVGMARVDRHAITLVAEDPMLATGALRWLVRHAQADRRRVRVVLRIAPAAAADIARHRWAWDLQLPVGQVVAARRFDGASPDAVQALVRIADPAVAGTFSAWRDALLAQVGGAGQAKGAGDEDF
jgi:hypothetical protein